MKLTIFFSCFFIANTIYCQENARFLSDSILTKNKVRKCVEYIKSDSATFFKTHPNGYYSIYNKQGKRIEQNYYISNGGIGITSWESEAIHYKIYDIKGNLVSSVEYDSMRVPPISNVTTYEYDSLNKQKSVKFFCENKEVKTSYSSISRKGFTPTGYKVDTIINEKAHLRFVEYTMVDTSFNDIYKTNSRIDSVLYTGAIRGQYGFMGYQHSKTYFNYYPNGSIKEMNFISYDDHILTIKQSFKYYQNGLLEEVITENRYNGLRKEISGFKYQYF